MKTILLPSGRAVSLGEYVRSWRALREISPSASVRHWSHFDTDARDILREIHKGIHARINRHIPGYGVGRNWNDDRFMEIRRAANDLNSRIRIYWLPPSLKARFAHRLARYDD